MSPPTGSQCSVKVARPTKEFVASTFSEVDGSLLLHAPRRNAASNAPAALRSTTKRLARGSCGRLAHDQLRCKLDAQRLDGRIRDSERQPHLDAYALERIPKESHWYRELIAEQRRSSVETAALSRKRSQTTPLAGQEPGVADQLAGTGRRVVRALLLRLVLVACTGRGECWRNRLGAVDEAQIRLCVERGGLDQQRDERLVAVPPA